MRGNAHGVEPRGLLEARNDRNREGRFGYMFKRQRPFEPSDELLRQLGEQMREPDGAHLDAPIPAGFTFFGQFIDHDMAFDTTQLEGNSRTIRRRPRTSAAPSSTWTRSI